MRRLLEERKDYLLSEAQSVLDKQRNCLIIAGERRAGYALNCAEKKDSFKKIV